MIADSAADTVRHAADIVQWMNLAIALAILLMVLAAGMKWPNWRRVLTLPLGYGVLATLFYVATLANAFTGPWASLLSALLRLYAHLMIAATLGVVIYIALREERDDGVGNGE